MIIWTLDCARHGITEHNRYGICSGRANTRLLSGGEAAAWCLGQKMKDEPLTAIYYSPLRRARETAEKFAEGSGTQAPLIPDARLIERCVEPFEGRVEKDVLAELRANGQLAAFEKLSPEEKMCHRFADEMESGQEVVDRFLAFVRSLPDKWMDGGRFFVCTHACPIGLILVHLGVKEYEHHFAGFVTPNAGMVHLSFDGKELSFEGIET